MIELVDVQKVYRRGQSEVHALRGVNLTVPDGQFLSIMGPSGSGKSTLLNVLGALDVPSTGKIRIEGKELEKLDDKALSIFRRDRIGFVFQFFNLLPTLTAIENVMLPSLLAGAPRQAIAARAQELLERVGLGKRMQHRPDELSGGEMQRVAVARALSTKPALLLADEPTGNLDSTASREILGLIREVTRERQVTVVMVTHDPQAAQVGDRLVRFADGRVVSDEAVAPLAAVSAGGH
ncbi:MAG: ABC transporter ATP-binding protein [Deltaproteobacteria bacterium]|nr:ABC transporter ATP-binding protein [Deltaproteobacteria bacterium]